MSEPTLSEPTLSEPIKITVNGRASTVEHGATVASWLAALGREPRAVAVERNGEIVPRASYEATALGEGDQLEVVHFVQGG